ncbi:E3 ubiquitin-protein ligase Mdm2-like, partial [Ochlerotatus camptorhynchus]|uniref:E3 ubiquitin-protein ligase Mdm2-like n=1 Tax=Ochlerotatus camptorhynchus TaxID=644619 RepID=UPI0031E1E153
VRKSFFPPRPKQKRKTRLKKVVEDGELSDSSTSSSSKSVVSNSLESNKFYGKTRSTAKISDSDSGSDIVINETSACRKQTDNNVNIMTSNENAHQGILKRTSLASSIIKNHKRRNSDESLNYESVCFKKRCDSEVLLPEVTEIKNKHLQLDVFKDSGFSSSSSQERTPTEEKFVFEETFSQETIESNRTSQHAIKKIDSAEAPPFSNSKLSFRCSTLSQVSCESTGSALYDNPYYNKQNVLHEPQSSDYSAIYAKSEHNLGLCMFCLSEPKNSVFVHSNFVHLCCCYKCAMKIWRQRKSCPICNCKVKNVMKLFVH